MPRLGPRLRHEETTIMGSIGIIGGYLGVWGLGFRVLGRIYRGHIGRMEKEKENYFNAGGRK